MVDFSKYPRTQRFLIEHPGMTLDQLLIWTENELKNKEREAHGQQPKQ